MKIITWNCNMAFRKKAKYLVEQKADIVIVPECECPEKLIFPEDVPKPDQVLWYGQNLNKGLGIFGYGKIKFKELDCHNRKLKLVIPIEVTKGSMKFNLFAIWANNVKDRKYQYVGQIWKALKCYDNLLTEGPSILAGDFNSNTIWDQPKRKGNHTHVVGKLREKGIYSCYHTYYNCEQGKEVHDTLFMYRHNDKGYHIDYCFASENFINNLITVDVGDHRHWCQLSDHVPLSVTFG